MMVPQTARLISRPIETADALAVCTAHASDPLVARYMTWRVHRHASDAEKPISPQCCRLWRKGAVRCSHWQSTEDPARLIGVFGPASTRIAWMSAMCSVVSTGDAG
jgi:hypothetical protein